MSYLLYYPYKGGNFELYKPEILLCGGKEPEKKEDWLDNVGAWPTFLWDRLIEDSIKDNSSKAEFFGGIQVYPKDFLKVVIQQCEGLAQGFLNT